MKNNERLERREDVEKLVSKVGVEMEELFWLELEEMVDQRKNVMNVLVNGQIEKGWLGLCGMICKEEGFGIQCLLFESGDSCNGGGDGMVKFGMKLSDGEGNMKCMKRIC